MWSPFLSGFSSLPSIFCQKERICLLDFGFYTVTKIFDLILMNGKIVDYLVLMDMSIS